MRRSAGLLLALAAALAACGNGAPAAGGCGRDYEIHGLEETERDVRRETGAESVTCRCLDPEAPWEYECESRFADGRTGAGYVEVTAGRVRAIYGDLGDPPPLPLERPPKLVGVSVTPESARRGEEVEIHVVLDDASGAGPWTLYALFFDPVPSMGSHSAELTPAGERGYAGRLRLPPNAEPGRWRLGEIQAYSVDTEHIELWTQFEHDGAWHDGITVVP